MAPLSRIDVENRRPAPGVAAPQPQRALFLGRTRQRTGGNHLQLQPAAARRVVVRMLSIAPASPKKFAARTNPRSAAPIVTTLPKRPRLQPAADDMRAIRMTI